MAAAAGSGSPTSPCGACKFLRRKCTAECVFAPYFCSEQGPARFSAVHKVFGASNASKLLLHVPPPHRFDAVLTIAYEAQARIHDPVHGCVAHIIALQQQVVHLQAELMVIKAEVEQIGSLPFPTMQDYYNIDNHSISPKSSLDGFSSVMQLQFSNSSISNGLNPLEFDGCANVTPYLL